MNSYTHILVGLDLTEECPEILQKSAALARACNAKLSVAHVIEPLTFAYGGDMPIDLSEVQDQLQIKAEQELLRLIKQADCQVEQEHILVGQPATELHHLADQLGADLIAVGSHGRKGFAVLLGSTSNSVLHGAACDVLAIRVNVKQDAK
ncbi:universal stress protein [Gilvimarinus sp. SDUM040013]|uniref:Universal stress protein n=1 Tax=Gilvimarinus gilvus TaxID=3058038 RepID=A0ABU4RYC4_9GAMM|nr:universal stress protein [Gilvimarinus sp. SDUM040013]MDO3386398.1 universal stress protein [Gilvimarinus sp. SDUM040013]MDX6849664.1 universal stress protein [Gilvimarinus sp. SDUM040013]